MVPARTSRVRTFMMGVVVALMLSACGGTSGPVDVSLAELAADHDAYEGDEVVVSGLVQSYDDPLHYWIEDPQQNRVEVEPHEEVEDLVGHEVRVQGTFTFADDRGRLIEIDELEVFGEAPQA